MDHSGVKSRQGDNAGNPPGEAARQRFEALLQAHRGIVYKVANTYCRNDEDRADLAQEIAVQLWRAFPSFDPQRSFSTWMYRIALNVAISQVRSNVPRQQNAVALDEQLHDVADDRAADPEAAQRLRALDRLIAALEPLNRALLLLYLEERSYREIGEVLGLSETNVATKIARLKQRIRTDLAD
ncbi:sigma-70 family RNA polymerase sigma factor [Lysobacter sp. Root690]|uniref:RNA polymerase sigma factor n=1 Tax=Lysobacter sp. Root690 TaxID=1736588 RepID=UPI0009EA4656|nr:sigma-70 family RNA polymerase sigma factor [Lysobacter sp. Root690]